MTEGEKRRVQKVSYCEKKHAVNDDSVDVEDAVVQRSEVARLRQALRRLPEPERKVICWRFGVAGSRELSIRQIAQRLNAPRSTVWDIEQRAMSLLRADYGVADEVVAAEVAA